MRKSIAFFAILACALVSAAGASAGTADGEIRLFPRSDGTVPAPPADSPSASGWEKAPEVRKARESGARAMITLEVVDQGGTPVVGADVSAEFSVFGRGVSTQRGRTDDSGRVAFTGTATWSISFRVEKEGWFGGMATYLLQEGLSGESVRGGRWMPWNPTVVLRLKKKSARASGFVDSVRVKGSSDQNEWVFDPWSVLEDGNSDDSVKRGKIVLKPSYQARDFPSDSPWHSSLSLSFPFPGDGVLPFVHDGTSDRTEPLFAPESGFADVTNFVLSGTGGRVETNSWPGAGTGVLFRISRDDETHFYGVLYSIRPGEKHPYVDLDYSLNTNANDRNLFIDLHSRLHGSLGRRTVSSAETTQRDSACRAESPAEPKEVRVLVTPKKKTEKREQGAEMP